MTAPRRTRIALYSPGIVGLGHLRRNLLISQVLSESALNSVNLLVTEAREASAFVNSMPAGVDCLTLPGLRKGNDGICKPRYLDLSLKEVISLRSRTIRAALKSFQPDLFLVDNLPRGAYSELDGTLKKLKAGGRTRFVLGLRDVLDDPWAVQRDWFPWQAEEAIRDYYDAIWVYGDPRVYNMIEEYRFPPGIASKIKFVGYLDQRRRMNYANRQDPELTGSVLQPKGRLILCLLGGGSDGDELAEAFAEARLPDDAYGVVVTGPFMSGAAQERLRTRAAANPRLRVLSFISEPTSLLAAADRVITMGGYNTVCEVLSFEKQALIVPRITPRREQTIRAERLRDLGLIHLLEIDKLTPQALSEWIRRDLPPMRLAGRIDFAGLDRLPGLAQQILSEPVRVHSAEELVEPSVTAINSS